MASSLTLISVIVPVYNAEKTLYKCIDSILAQSYPAFELLLIDDGSIDSSIEICHSYAKIDNRIRVYHKSNGGASSARNFGLSKAKGDWVTFCDSDDWVYPMWLQNFRNSMGHVDYVCQGIETDSLLSKRLKRPPYEYSLEYFGNVNQGVRLLYESEILGYTVISCFKKQIIDANCLTFNTKYNLHEDQEFVLRYLKYCQLIKCVNKVGYFYYVPDFGRKYVLQNNYDLYESLYLSIVDVEKGQASIVTEDYLYFLTEALIKNFRSSNFRKKIELLLRYRKVVGRNVLNSSLFFMTKWIIYMDSTGLFSTVWLNFHLIIKDKKANV